MLSTSRRGKRSRTRRSTLSPAAARSTTCGPGCTGGPSG